MNRTITTICLSMSCMLIGLLREASAQNFTHDFGKYSLEEFQMNKYDKDPSSEAVVIYDIGLSHFDRTDEGFQLVFERKTKIKIFTKAGLRWAQFEIPFYIGEDREEIISDLAGNTYNYEKGLVLTTPLNTKNTFDEKTSEHWRVKKFAMPDVKEGSVIEVKYKITSPYFFNFRSWAFQNKIPVIYSEYKTKMIPFYEYRYILQGANKFDAFNSYVDQGLPNQFRSISYQDMVYEFIMENQPAFKDEKFITSAEDYIVKIDFQLSTFHRPDGVNVKYMTTWPKLIQDMLDEDAFGKYYKSCLRSGKEINDTMKLAQRSAREKAEIIDRYVKLNFNWNGNEDKLASKTLKDFLKTKTGNSADINLYLAGLLNAAGVEAYPVIISTRDHGKIKVDYPFHHFFNYVVVIIKIDDKYLFLDATESLAQFAEVPPRCLNDKGLIINKAKTEWATFGSQKVSIVENNIDLKLSGQTDTASVSFKINANGYNALSMRRIYLRNPANLKKELMSNTLTLKDSIKTNNLYQIEKPFEVSFNANVIPEKVEDKILISPFCDIPISENPLKQPYRTYPIDMVYKNGQRYVTTIHIPDGYKLITKPANLTVNNNQVEIQYLTEQPDNNSIKITGYYVFKKDMYDSSEYNYIKGYFAKIVDKFNEKIVLAKN
ncbi:MAG TPA: DUF3857 domain-containing protein [Bacteroidales bacterium]